VPEGIQISLYQKTSKKGNNTLIDTIKNRISGKTLKQPLSGQDGFYGKRKTFLMQSLNLKRNSVLKLPFQSQESKHISNSSKSIITTLKEQKQQKLQFNDQFATSIYLFIFFYFYFFSIYNIFFR
jgi:hypothetical protein